MTPARNPDLSRAMYDVQDQWESQPYLLYRTDILDFFNELFRVGSKNVTFEESVLLGALAAKAMSQASRQGHAYEIPIIASDAKKKLKMKESIQWARNLERNVAIKLNLVSSLINIWGIGTVDISPFYNENGELNTETYEKGKDQFEKEVPEHDNIFKAIALNLFMDTFLFVSLQKYNLFEFYSYFTVCLAAVQTSGYLAGLKKDDVENEFILNTSKLSRGISHSEKFAQIIIDALKKSEIIYPPQLACIIK